MRIRNDLLIVLGMLGALGCAPVATTAVAVGAAGYQRAHGGCVAACTPGNVCNPDTGFCDPIPCARGCGAGQSCVATATGSRCEATAALTVHGSPDSVPGGGK